MRNHFREELYNKVKNKFDEKTAIEVTSFLEEMGYLNDEVTVESYIRQKLLSGYGPYYISNKLYEKGCQRDISFIEDIAVKENIEMSEYIKKYAQRYIKDNSSDPYKDYVKCLNFLKNKGYSLTLIRENVKKEDFGL